MNFGNPEAAFLFPALALIAVLLFLADRKRQRSLETFAARDLLPALLFARDDKKKRLRVAILFLAFAFCILALMRPQGSALEEVQKSRGLDIMVAIDTSKSMLAEDVKPNRLERSKAMARKLVSRLQGDRVGLIAFSGTAFLVCPLTVDYNAFLLSLDSLDANAVSRGGTSLSSAIREAGKGFKGARSKAGILLMMTDGEDHEGNPVQAAAEAINEGITIFTLGAGTEGGDLIAATDARGERSFVKDRQGNVVKSRLNETVLKQIASAAGGRYARLTSLDDGPADLYGQWFSALERRETTGRAGTRYREWFQLPLIFAFLLLIGETVLVERRKDG